MNNQELHEEIKRTLTQYHIELEYFNPIDTEFHFFKALDSRKYLKVHQSSMNTSELLMLTVVDKLTIEAYESVKNDSYDEFCTAEQLKQQENYVDLQKAVLIARKNLKDSKLVELATKVQNLNHSELIFNSCISETF